jgi:ferredoxin-NADP reductase
MLTLRSVNFEHREFQNHHLEKSHPGQTEWTIGRNTTCDLVLTSPEVSRVHGRIVYLDGAYYFIDLESASGSLLNGEVVPVEEPRPLQQGDLLQLGETFLYIEALTMLPMADSDLERKTNTQLPTQLWGTEDLTCRCCRIIDETPDVKTFYFVAEPAVQFSYEPGQFVNLAVTIDGKNVIRPYSISSAPTRPYHLSVTVKRVPSPKDQPGVPPGLVSNWLHDHLKVGDRVKLIGGAMGQFTCVPNLPSKILFISAGSGITPMMSMLRWLQDTLSDCDITFLHSAATPEDIVFRRELEAIDMQMPNLRLAVTVTRPTASQPWMGLTGRISQSLLSVIVPDLMERSVYVCGSEGFMRGTRSLLESMNFPMQNYREESFGGQSLKSASAPAETQKRNKAIAHAIAQPTAPDLVTARNGKGKAPSSLPTTQPSKNPIVQFTQSNCQAIAESDGTILEAAEEEGVPIRSACRAGACGMCKVRVAKGQVRYQTSPTALTIADQQAGYVLACVASPVGAVEVEA